MSSDEQLIKIEVAARLLMIGPERVRQLAKAGYIEIPKRGHTTIVSAVQGYIRSLKDSHSAATKKGSANRAQDARAEEIELRLRERKRELIPQEEALEAMTLLVGKVNDEFNGLASRYTRDIDERKLIEAEVDGSKARIAGALGKLAGFVSTGGETPNSI